MKSIFDYPVVTRDDIEDTPETTSVKSIHSKKGLLCSLHYFPRNYVPGVAIIH